MRFHLIVVWLACALLHTQPVHACYSYSVTINKHKIDVTVRSKTNFDFRIDGKLYKGKEEKTPARQPNEPKLYAARAHLPGLTVILMTAGPTLYVNTAKSDSDDDHDMSIDAIPANSKNITSVQGMKPMLIDGKKVFLSKARNESGVTRYFFKYQLKTKSHVFDILQIVYSKKYEKRVPEPFAAAVKTFKLSRVK